MKSILLTESLTHKEVFSSSYESNNQNYGPRKEHLNLGGVLKGFKSFAKGGGKAVSKVKKTAGNGGRTAAKVKKTAGNGGRSAGTAAKVTKTAGNRGRNAAMVVGGVGAVAGVGGMAKNGTLGKDAQDAFNKAENALENAADQTKNAMYDAFNQMFSFIMDPIKNALGAFASVVPIIVFVMFVGLLYKAGILSLIVRLFRSKNKVNDSSSQENKVLPPPVYGPQPYQGTPPPVYGPQPYQGTPPPVYGPQPYQGTPPTAYGPQPYQGTPPTAYGPQFNGPQSYQEPQFNGPPPQEHAAYGQSYQEPQYQEPQYQEPQSYRQGFTISPINPSNSQFFNNNGY